MRKRIFCDFIKCTICNKIDNSWKLIEKHKKEEKLFESDPLLWLKLNYHFCIAAIISGFISGLIGIGGGIILTTYMAGYCDLTQHEAVATSLMSMIPSAFIGAMTHYINGHVVIPIAIVLALTAAFGMYISSQIALDIPDYYLRILFCILLVLSSRKMFLPR